VKIGDVVMFTDNGTYAKWFFGQLGIIIAGPSISKDGIKHIRVEWVQPIPYHGRKATVSDFATDKFEVAHEA
tara:strand:+ start:1483 stop:1698 length:216 start_codon:yes stop_codon:yes gene_type:complete